MHFKGAYTHLTGRGLIVKFFLNLITLTFSRMWGEQLPPMSE